jgi:hypothetical protein
LLTLLAALILFLWYREKVTIILGSHFSKSLVAAI